MTQHRLVIMHVCNVDVSSLQLASVLLCKVKSHTNCHSTHIPKQAPILVIVNIALVTYGLPKATLAGDAKSQNCDTMDGTGFNGHILHYCTSFVEPPS